MPLNKRRTLSGTKIDYLVSISGVLLLAWVIIYGSIRFGLLPEYWGNLSYIIVALGGIIWGVHSSTEKRKRMLGIGSEIIREDDTRGDDQ
jgi:hypothetical protein